MKYQKILKLMSSGNFTIAYHDNEAPSLYEGKWKYEELEDKEEIDLTDWYYENGYCPSVVSLLVDALGGESTSI